MIFVITISIVCLCMVLLFPWDEIFPARYLSNTLNKILSKKTNKEILNNSKWFKKINKLLDLIIKVFRINKRSLKLMNYSKLLRSANYDHKFTPEQFFAGKILFSLIVFGYFVLLLLLKFDFFILLLAIVTSFVVFYLPEQWLKIQVNKRKIRIRQDMPSLLVSLAVTTDAGLSLLQALDEVSHQKDSILSEEIKKTLMEISLGISQKEAFNNLSNRVRVEEITLFVSGLTQTLEKGSSGITRLLREQANDAWQKRKITAKELGEKASIKLFFPLVLFIFPALMIFLISPAIFSIIKFFEI